jgi:hypothetical protein
MTCLFGIVETIDIILKGKNNLGYLGIGGILILKWITYYKNKLPVD